MNFSVSNKSPCSSHHPEASLPQSGLPAGKGQAAQWPDCTMYSNYTGNTDKASTVCRLPEAPCMPRGGDSSVLQTGTVCTGDRRNKEENLLNSNGILVLAPRVRINKVSSSLYSQVPQWAWVTYFIRKSTIYAMKINELQLEVFFMFKAQWAAADTSVLGISPPCKKRVPTTL